MPVPLIDWQTTGFEDKPAEADLVSGGNEEIQNTRKGSRERGDDEHHWKNSTGTEAHTGEHRHGSARVMHGTAANRTTITTQISLRTDALPTKDIENPSGLYFYETDTGLVYYHDGTTGWVLQSLEGESAGGTAQFVGDTSILTNLGLDSLASQSTTHNYRSVAPFRVTSPSTSGEFVNVQRGLYVDDGGVIREYAGNKDFSLGASPTSGNDRIDLLYLAGSTLTELQGTETATPALIADAPTLPHGIFPLALIYRRALDTAFNEIDAGGATAYLFRDLRSIVSASGKRVGEIGSLATDTVSGDTVIGTTTPTALTGLSVTITPSTSASVIRLYGGGTAMYSNAFTGHIFTMELFDTTGAAVQISRSITLFPSDRQEMSVAFQQTGLTAGVPNSWTLRGWNNATGSGQETTVLGTGNDLAYLEAVEYLR